MVVGLIERNDPRPPRGQFRPLLLAQGPLNGSTVIELTTFKVKRERGSRVEWGGDPVPRGGVSFRENLVSVNNRTNVEDRGLTEKKTRFK